MNKQHRDLFFASLKLFLIVFPLAVLISWGSYFGMRAMLWLFSIQRSLPQPPPFHSIVFYLYIFIIAIVGAALFAFINFWFSRFLGEDPFRYSRTLKAYFRSKNEVFLPILVEKLKKNFSNILLVSKSENVIELRWIVKPTLLNDTINHRLLIRNATREIRSVKICALPEPNRHFRFEIMVEPESKVKFFNTAGANHLALKDLINALEWHHLRVDVDEDGKPNWNKTFLKK